MFMDQKTTYFMEFQLQSTQVFVFVNQQADSKIQLKIQKNLTRQNNFEKKLEDLSFLTLSLTVMLVYSIDTGINIRSMEKNK